MASCRLRGSTNNVTDKVALSHAGRYRGRCSADALKGNSSYTNENGKSAFLLTHKRCEVSVLLCKLLIQLRDEVGFFFQ